MPETAAQWAWCAFFTIGALGGWVVVIATGQDMVKALQRTRAAVQRQRK